MFLSVHRILIALLVVVTAATGGTWYYALRPIQERNAELTKDRDEKFQTLRRSGLPLVPQKLRSIRADLSRQQGELGGVIRQLHDVAMGQFDRRLEVYDSVLGFRKSVGQLDYQEIYNSVTQELARERIFLNPAKLGLSEQSTSSLIYQQVAQLWVIQDVATLARTHNLDLTDYNFVSELDASGKPTWDGPPPADLQALPVRSYVTSVEDPVFLEEYPVKVVATGSPENLGSFLLDLTRDGRFLPLQRISLRKVVRGRHNFDQVEATMTLSAFLILADKSDFDVKVEIESRHHVPPARPGI